MKLSRRSTLRQVAAAVAGALHDAGISAVLTGGACATIYSEGAYQSEDLDLILLSSPTQKALDQAMAELGFSRRRDFYEHPSSSFFVEFPRGPLSIGSDLSVKPAEMLIDGVRVTLLSATDSCRDRLAAFYHWRDRQGLQAAVAIAARHDVDLERIRAWSEREAESTNFEEFRRELRIAKASRRRLRGVRSAKRSR
ncbi:MAG TPA: hypothetical protein PLB01_05335 [Thermoanaerobaculia bacterium]|nr:hypothetical protein [Thermoanaerobaculia bacterium]